MPSLISRFLGKRKNADHTSLLDGEKYEAVPKTTSPSAATFAESAQRPKSPKPKQKVQSDKGLGIPIRRKQASPNVPARSESKLPEIVPYLSLHLPDPKLEERRLPGLGVVFEGVTDGSPRLDEEALGTKRLTPAETLSLVQKTSEVICERGLETLGVMRPHWFASPRQQEVQLKLINRFLQSLSSQQTNGAAASSSSPATFESDLRYTHDMHDVAAVLRWGLRHLQLEGNTFGSSDSVDWYQSFVDSERSGSYPSKAFDDILMPLLPASHAQLLRTTLDLISSLAAHSEVNGISGNKLSKVLGWWIVSSRNVQNTGWHEFYAKWEAAARQFEHLFLAYIRAQEAQSRIPRRLTELVKNYPFVKNRREEDGIFLPRSRFSTRSASALFIKVTADKSGVSSYLHPLRVVEDAFKANPESQSTDKYMALWQEIRTIASKPATPGDEPNETSATEASADSLNLSLILADESIRLLSLVPTPDGPDAPTLSLFTSLPTGRARRSLSVGDRSPNTPVANGNIQGSSKDVSYSNVTTTPLIPPQQLDVTTDWQVFSSAGFHSPSGLSLAASLWDNDTEVTRPAEKKSVGVGKRNLSIRSGQPRPASVDSPSSTQYSPDAKPGRLTYGTPRIVKLDEAFIDFWADSLLDTIARSWPTFVVCQLKSRIMEDDKPIEWLVIERVAAEPVRRSPPPVKTSATSGRAASPVQTSPTKSEGGKSARWATSTLSATRKRWSFFSPRHESAPVGKDRAARKATKNAKVGELGEILQEEEEGKTNGVMANGAKTEAEVPQKVSETTQKQPEKPQDVVQTPPVIQVNNVSKPEELAVAASKEVVTPKGVEPTVAAVEHTSDLSAAVEEASGEPKLAAQSTATQIETHPTQPEPEAEQASSGQPVTRPTHDPEGKLISLPGSTHDPEEQVIPSPEPTHVQEERQVLETAAPVEEPQPSLENEHPPQPPSKAEYALESQSVEEQPQRTDPVSETPDEPEASTAVSAMKDSEPAHSALPDSQQRPPSPEPQVPAPETTSEEKTSFAHLETIDNTTLKIAPEALEDAPSGQPEVFQVLTPEKATKELPEAPRPHDTSSPADATEPLIETTAEIPEDIGPVEEQETLSATSAPMEPSEEPTSLEPEVPAAEHPAEKHVEEPVVAAANSHPTPTQEAEVLKRQNAETDISTEDQVADPESAPQAELLPEEPEHPEARAIVQHDAPAGSEAKEDADHPEAPPEQHTD